MIIETNNGTYLEIHEAWTGVTVKTITSKKMCERSDHFGEGEIVMAINLLRYMRDNNQKSVWLLDDSTKEYLQNLIQNLIRNGDLYEFRLLQ